MKCARCELRLEPADLTTIDVVDGLPQVVHAQCPEVPPPDPEIAVHKHGRTVRITKDGPR